MTDAAQTDSDHDKAGVTELVPAEDERPQVVATPAPRTVFMGILVFLAVLVAFHFAAAIILPIVLAVVLKLLLQPALRPFEKIYIPRAISALIVVLMMVGAIVGLGALVSGPAISWAQKVPASFPRLEQHLKVLTRPFAEIGVVLKRAEKVAQGPNDGTPEVTVKSTGLADTLAGVTFNVAVGILTIIVLLYFLLASGDIFLRRIVEILPRFQDKRQAVEIVQNIEHDVSAYLITVSIINAVLGVAVGIAMHFCGLSDAIVWGAVAFLLNFVPILGPLVGVAIFALIGLMSFDTIGPALLPAGVYLALHVIEGEFLTPMILAKRLTLNPVIVILSLIFWYWLWGVPGAILAVPIIVIVKIIADHVETLRPFGHFLEG